MKPEGGLLFNAKMRSANGPSRHFAASQQFGRFRSEADISERFVKPDL
jgi:hypothetical protein